MENVVLYVVIPCYCEEAVLLETSSRLQKKMKSLMEKKLISPRSKVLFVDDGSTDGTWNIIDHLHKVDGNLWGGVSLSRNRGHQNALLAGLNVAKECADIVISIDADLQDDLDAMDEMIEKYDQGCDIVYGVREERKKDTFLKRFTAESFYRVLYFLGAKIIYNHADYRLMSKRALHTLMEYKEVNLFLRGIIPMLGYKSACVYYLREERFAGESKYPLKKMIAFAWEGITSCSVRLINFITWMGLLNSALSVLFIIWLMFKYAQGETIEGWTSVVVSLWFFGGVQMLAIGIIGEYVGKIYLETKKRPRFVIQEVLNDPIQALKNKNA